jgi:hypothetical protein
MRATMCGSIDRASGIHNYDRHHVRLAQTNCAGYLEGDYVWVYRPSITVRVTLRATMCGSIDRASGIHNYDRHHVRLAQTNCAGYLEGDYVWVYRPART